MTETGVEGVGAGTPPWRVVEPVMVGLRRLVSGRPVVCAGSQLLGEGLLGQLRELGATRVLVVGPPELAGRAVAGGAVFLPVDLHAPDSTAGERGWRQALAEPSASLREAVEEHDPVGRALVLVPPWSESAELLSRPVFGARRPAWVAMEDKLVAESLWDAAGVQRAPAEVVPCRLAELTAAAARLDRGLGTVWAGDASRGVHGGASAVRWVRDQADAGAAVQAFAGRHRMVRVMPFLEGRPCGIHGMVLLDGVVVLRPVEHVVVRTPAGGHLRQAGVSTVWEPAADDGTTMRELARRVGAELARRVGFRASFSIDGVLTAEGFRPTECNARWGAAMYHAVVAAPELPLVLVHHAVADGHRLGVTAAALEDYLLAATAATRRASAFSYLHRLLPDQEFGLQRTAAGGWVRAPLPGCDAVVQISRAYGNGHAVVRFAADRLPAGRSIAAQVVLVLGWLDAHLDAGIGPIEAPPDDTCSGPGH